MLFRRFTTTVLIGFLVFAATGGALAQELGPAAPQAPAALSGRGFTYQGELRSGSSAVTATCDFQFGLYDAATLGAQQGVTQTVTTVGVANGRFTVTLNSAEQFGARAFDGSARWLASAVKCPADGGFVALTPRQPLTAAPLALALPGLRTELTAGTPNIIGGYISNTVGAGVVGATLSGGGNVGLLNTINSNYATLGGGRGNTAAGFAATLGGGDGNTTGGSSATVSGGLNNSASADYAAVGGGNFNLAGNFAATIGGGANNAASGQYATIAGGGINSILITTTYATIGGGGNNLASNSYVTVGGGLTNTASGQYATISGGSSNTANGNYAMIGGGVGNTASALYGTIGGGRGNTASGAGAFVGGGGWNGLFASGNTAAGLSSAIGGGFANLVNTAAIYGTIGGGSNNTVSNQYATVGGGTFNTASSLADTVSGGASNTASGGNATVSGGASNTASGQFATVSGGNYNAASGSYATLSGGYASIASGTNATVSGGASNNASNQYATISGGIFNTASGSYATVAGGYGNTASGDYSFAAGADAYAIHPGAFVWANQTGIPISSTVAGQFLVRATGGISLTTNAAGTTGCNLSAGGGTWNCTSDRNAKANFAPVNGVAVLDALMAIPIQTWNFNTQDAGIQHMGPMAQDFYAAYGLGEGELTISTVDADGVALAAIQGLYTVVQQKDAEIAALTARVDALESATALEQGGPAAVNGPAPAPSSNTLQLLVVLVIGLVAGGGLTLGAFVLGQRQAAPVKA